MRQRENGIRSDVWGGVCMRIGNVTVVSGEFKKTELCTKVGFRIPSGDGGKNMAAAKLIISPIGTVS